ncbi:MAG TPA: DUF4432 domain-containing protein [Actinobacteria bacterium]|nr:DUF4432 domain-containing protein [Actinomycetota bacterium]
MKIFGNDFDRQEISKRTGDITQLGGIRFFEFSDGMAKGTRAANLKSINGGIEMTVVTDRAMDISAFSYKGIPLVWRSCTGETNPSFYEARKDEWLRSFFGGLLTTCGLTYFGDPVSNDSEELGLHGRIANIAAKEISSKSYWENDDYIMEIKGKVRQVKALTEKLELSRCIKLFSSESMVSIEDSIENFGFNQLPLMVLYHMNFGWPLLDDKAELYVGKGEIIPLNDDAEKNAGMFDNFIKPVSNFNPEVFAHDIKADSEGFCHTALVNRNLDESNGLGIGLKFKKENLPYLIEWKNFNPGEYVLGLEPGNAFVSGRDKERDAGRVRTINPGEKVEMKIEIRILDGQQKIDDYIKKHIK